MDFYFKSAIYGKIKIFFKQKYFAFTGIVKVDLFCICLKCFDWLFCLPPFVMSHPLQLAAMQVSIPNLKEKNCCQSVFGFLSNSEEGKSDVVIFRTCYMAYFPQLGLGTVEETVNCRALVLHFLYNKMEEYFVEIMHVTE